MDIVDLADLAPIGQLAAYTTLTLASITVAGLQGLVAYRNSFGWKPLIFVANAKFGLGSTPDSFTATYEVWNRRKYPIQVRSAHVLVTTYYLHNGNKQSKPSATYNHEHAEGGRDFLIEPSDHRRFDFEAISADTGNNHIVVIDCRVTYFDPRKGKEREISVSRGYSMECKAEVPAT